MLTSKTVLVIDRKENIREKTGMLGRQATRPKIISKLIMLTSICSETHTKFNNYKSQLYGRIK